MSRFSDDYDEDFPNQGALWTANTRRALGGKKGQAALRELEQALVELPEKVLISGHLAAADQVCTVGALAVHRRVRDGQDREIALRELERLIPVGCKNCWHREDEHDDKGCRACREFDERRGFVSEHTCAAWTPDLESDWNGDGALETAEEGRRLGLSFNLAWHLAYVNDEYGPYDETPEQRYERVLAWVRSAIHESVAA